MVLDCWKGFLEGVERVWELGPILVSGEGKCLLWISRSVVEDGAEGKVLLEGEVQASLWVDFGRRLWAGVEGIAEGSCVGFWLVFRVI